MSTINQTNASINQLNDDGSVIGYKPNLEYRKELNNTTETINHKQSDMTGNITYSNTLEGIINNSPSATISDIDFVIDNIKLLIDKLASKFKSENWGEYNNISSLLNAINSKNDKYIDEFINAHNHNINGSIIPEIMGILYQTSNRMETLNDIIKEMYYGDNKVTQEEIEAKDKSFLTKLKQYEEASQNHKINYVSISYDSMFNRCISHEVFGINKKSIEISKIVDNNTDITNNSNDINTLNNLYNEVNSDIDYKKEAFEIQQTIEIMKNSLYNYYNKRNEYINIYNIYNGQEDFSMTNRLYEHKYKLERSIENVVRSIHGNQYYLSQLTFLEKEKSNLMFNYSKLSYNY